MATLIGSNSNNCLTGTAAADTMVGRAGNDQLSGNGGSDRLNGGVGNDLLNGGAGIDTADYSNLIIGGTRYIGATTRVIVNLNLTGPQNTGGAGTDTLVSIENLTGSNFNDGLAGNGATNVLMGLSGNDVLAGAAGNDQLGGGDGNDLLNGGVGNDLLTGGGWDRHGRLRYLYDRGAGRSWSDGGRHGQPQFDGSTKHRRGRKRHTRWH